MNKFLITPLQSLEETRKDVLYFFFQTGLLLGTYNFSDEEVLVFLPLQNGFVQAVLFSFGYHFEFIYKSDEYTCE